MGISKAYGVDPYKMALDFVKRPEELLRRQEAKSRVDLFKDRTGEALRGELRRIFDKESEHRLRKYEAFSWMAASLSIFKRIVNEIAAPLYSPPPLRIVDAAAQDGWRAFERDSELNKVMRKVAKGAMHSNTLVVHPRHVERLGRFVVHTFTPDRLSVIPDPDDMLRPCAIMYRTTVYKDGRPLDGWVFWDDAVSFRFATDTGELVGNPIDSKSGHPGVIPMLAVHAVDRDEADGFFDRTTGNDLVRAQVGVTYCLAATLRVLHTQGHQQLGISGSPENFPQDQVLDPENPVFAGEGNQIVNLYNPTSVDGFLKVIDAIVTNTSANYGLSRDRINARAGDQAGAADSPLLAERRRELLEVMFEAERDLFSLQKVLAPGTVYAVPASAEIEVAYEDVTAKVDRQTMLTVRKEERSMGYRSVLDDVLEDNPELEGDRARALEYVMGRMQEEATYIELRRSLGISGEATVEEPGQAQALNGAMGPKVRDGHMSKDEAAEQATTGPVRAA
jgi:hypothetical protein